MFEHDGLSNLLLTHWQTHRPMFLSQLRQTNKVNETLSQTRDQMAELLYQLMSVQKLEPHQAWELATEQFLLTEESA